MLLIVQNHAATILTSPSLFLTHLLPSYKTCSLRNGNFWWEINFVTFTSEFINVILLLCSNECRFSYYYNFMDRIFLLHNNGKLKGNRSSFSTFPFLCPKKRVRNIYSFHIIKGIAYFSPCEF